MPSPNTRERSSLSTDDSVPSPTLIIGLGNPILGDDGVGWRIAEQVEQKITNSAISNRKNCSLDNNRSVAESIEIDYLAVGGLSLMERLVGYDRAIIIDAVQTGRVPVGEVVHTTLDELSETEAAHLTSSHDTSLQQAIKVGRSMGAHLPKEIIIVGIEAKSVFDFSEELSDPIAAALPEAINFIMEMIE